MGDSNVDQTGMCHRPLKFTTLKFTTGLLSFSLEWENPKNFRVLEHEHRKHFPNIRALQQNYLCQKRKNPQLWNWIQQNSLFTLYELCEVRARICSTSEDVQCESGTSSVQARMCSTSKVHLHYKQGCTVRIRRIFSASEDLQYKQGTSSVQARMCSTNQSHHQYKQGCAVQASRLSSFCTGGITQKYLPMNESLLSLIYPVKTISSQWQAAEIN